MWSKPVENGTCRFVPYETLLSNSPPHVSSQAPLHFATLPNSENGKLLRCVQSSPTNQQEEGLENLEFKVHHLFFHPLLQLTHIQSLPCCQETEVNGPGYCSLPANDRDSSRKDDLSLIVNERPTSIMGAGVLFHVNVRGK